MSKYSFEFKLEVVKYCIDNYHSKYDAAKKFKIPSPTPIMEWIRKYKVYRLYFFSYRNLFLNSNLLLW